MKVGREAHSESSLSANPYGVGEGFGILQAPRILPAFFSYRFLQPPYETVEVDSVVHGLFVTHKGFRWKWVVTGLGKEMDTFTDIGLFPNVRHRRSPCGCKGRPTAGHASTIDSIAFSVRSIFSTNRYGTSVAKQEERIRGDICSGAVLCRIDRHT